jgi:hypothetical protein
MSNPLVVAVVVALIGAAVLLMRNRKSEPARVQALHGAEPGAHHDYAKEHEDARVAHMSADDRAWEAASLQRNRDMTGRAADAAEERA